MHFLDLTVAFHIYMILIWYDYNTDKSSGALTAPNKGCALMDRRTPLFTVILLLFSLFSLSAISAATAQEWYEQALSPQEGLKEEGPCWGDWFFDGDRWLREATPPDGEEYARFLVDVYGNWFSLDPSGAEIISPSDPPQWYPWDDTPESMGLPPKGKDEILSEQGSRTFRMGEWENVFGVWYKRVSPPGLLPAGVSHLVDSEGRCYVLVVYPGASPRPVERFPWFPGFPPGWGIRPGISVLVEMNQ